MQNRDIVLDVSGLSVRYKVGRREVRAVNEASFSLERGSILGIVGESGCGKSATAHAITRLLPKNGAITAGAVDYFPRGGGKIILSGLDARSRDMRAIRGAEISMIFQDPLSSLNPVYTVGRQITEALREHENLTRDEARRRAVELLARLGIPKPNERFDDYPHQFSGGMKQRVMIAIAMVCNPAVLIADEPTTALDVTIQAQIIDLMRELRDERGTSIALITHNMGLVAEACDEVAVMYMGRVVEFGSLKQVFTNPLHPYTAALMRSVPVLGMSRERELSSIAGSTPEASEAFEGCEFAERCERACARCKIEPPRDCEPEAGHRARCHIYDGGGEAL